MPFVRYANLYPLFKNLISYVISEKLDISFGSVATYIRRIYEKLEVLNAPAAVNYRGTK